MPGTVVDRRSCGAVICAPFSVVVRRRKWLTWIWFVERSGRSGRSGRSPLLSPLSQLCIWYSDGVSYSSRFSIGALHSINVFYTQKLRSWHHRAHAVAIAVSRSGWVESPYHQTSIRRVCESSRLIWFLVVRWNLRPKAKLHKI